MAVIKRNIGLKGTKGKYLYTEVAVVMPGEPIAPNVTGWVSYETTTSAFLTWDATTDTDDYDVQYKLSSSGTWLNSTTGRVSTSWTVNGLTSVDEYDFRIIANGTNGSTNGLVTTVISAPFYPANRQVTDISGTSVSLSWDAVTNAESYRLNRIPGGVIASGITGTTYTDNTVSEGVNYSYYWNTYNSTHLYNGGYSTNSPEVLANIPNSPNAPTGLNATNITRNSLTLNWSNGGGGAADHYEVEYKLTSEPTVWTMYDNNVSGLNRAITGLTQETSYDFRVTAVNTTASATSTTYTVSTIGTTTLTVQNFTPDDWMVLGVDGPSALNDDLDTTLVYNSGGNGTCTINLVDGNGMSSVSGVTIFIRIREANGSTSANYTITAFNDGTSNGENISGAAPSTWTTLSFVLAGTFGGVSAGIQVTRSGGGNPNNRMHLQVAKVWAEY